MNKTTKNMNLKDPVIFVLIFQNLMEKLLKMNFKFTFYK